MCWWHFVLCLSEQQKVVVEEDGDQGSGCLEDAVQILVSKFHFVDLAGSERVGRTGNYGERFKGTCVQKAVNVCICTLDVLYVAKFLM